MAGAERGGGRVQSERGEQEWRSGESTRLPPMWPGFKSRRRRHMWVEFVVGSLPCSERFYSGYSGFPLFSKANIFKFQFDQKSGRRRTTMWMCYLQIVIYLFIYLFRGREESAKARKREGSPLLTLLNPPSLFPFFPIPYLFRSLLRRLVRSS